MTTTPDQFNRRSPLHAWFSEQGATFTDIGDAAVVSGFPDREAPPLGLLDLTPLPRTGVKGRRALAWLAEVGWPVPGTNNTSVVTASAQRVARLADGEALILSAIAGDAGRVRELADAIPGAGAWPVARRDGSCWFLLAGDAAVDCLQKLCGIDLRPERFPADAVAQTSVARTNAVLIRDAALPRPAFHILADSASTGWFHAALLDAMAEFDGAPMGVDEL